MPQLTTRALSPMARLQVLRSEILLVVTWGSIACHLRKEVVSMVASALVRMANVILHLFRPDGE